MNAPEVPGLELRAIEDKDPPIIARAFDEIGWDKQEHQYRRYKAEQDAGTRAVRIAVYDGSFAGYLTVAWKSHYPPFREAGIPEIVDLNVLPAVRRRGIASVLLDWAETAVAERSAICGIGVGLYSDYGNAQRLYVKRGYVPDGRGVCYDGMPVRPMAWVRNDDALNMFFTKRVRA